MVAPSMQDQDRRSPWVGTAEPQLAEEPRDVYLPPFQWGAPRKRPALGHQVTRTSTTGPLASLALKSRLQVEPFCWKDRRAAPRAFFLDNLMPVN